MPPIPGRALRRGNNPITAHANRVTRGRHAAAQSGVGVTMLSDLLTKLGTFSSGLDSDYADRLNFRYTSLFLICMGILVTTRQFTGDPIVCWSPNNFNSQWVKYSDAFCWVSNTYYLPLDSHHDHVLDGYRPHELHYYQWVPLILFLQALFFIIPHFLWRSMYVYAGFDFEEVTKHAVNFAVQIDEDAWCTLIHRLARHIDRYLELQKSAAGSWCAKFRAVLSGRCIVAVSRHYGNFLTYAYPCIKFLFVLNILMQLYMLSLWLGEEYRWYGINVLYALVLYDARVSDVTNLFPRVTWCKVQERKVETLLTHQMNCVLPINLFNEIVFLVVWFWLTTVFVITTTNLARWFLNCSYMGEEYVRKHLKFACRLQTTEEKKLFKRFLHGYLKQDGVFIVRMLSRNTSSIFISDLLSDLFDGYKLKTADQRRQARADRLEERAAQNCMLTVESNNASEELHSLLISGGTHSKQPPPVPPPLYQRFANQLDAGQSTRSCDNLFDKQS